MGQRTWATLLSVILLSLILSLNIVQSNQKVLLASNFAIYDQLKHLAPNDQKVAMLMPFGQDSHTFQPSPKNITMMIESIAFFYVSQGLDRWVEKLEPLKGAKNGIDLSPSINWVEGEEEHEHGHDEDHGADSFDPHYWLDLTNQKASSEKIYKKLVKIFPQNREEITRKYDLYIQSLENLEEAYQKRLNSCQKSELFVTHNAFSYLEKEGFFKIESVVGLSPESAPNPSKMKEIIGKLSKNGIKTIFFESFTSDDIAMAIANEVGIEVGVLDTLATISAKEAKSAVSYSDLMLKNLDKISKALVCQ